MDGKTKSSLKMLVHNIMHVEISVFNTVGIRHLLDQMTLVNLNKKEMPEELSHEEVIALKDLDLDTTLLELTSDD